MAASTIKSKSRVNHIYLKNLLCLTFELFFQFFTIERWHETNTFMYKYLFTSLVISLGNIFERNFLASMCNFLQTSYMLQNITCYTPTSISSSSALSIKIFFSLISESEI